MTFTIQISKGFVPENCDACGEYFWIRSDLAYRVRSSGKHLRCRDCQIARGFDVPAWPCGRHLDDRELDELEMERARNSIAYEIEEPRVDEPKPEEPRAEEPLLTIGQIRDQLSYYFDVTRTTKKEFIEAVGISGPSFYTFMKGGGLRDSTRLKLLAEMEKRGWIAVEQETQPEPPQLPESTEAVDPVNEAIPESRPALSEAEKRFLTYSLYHAHGDRDEKDALLDKILSAFSG